MDVKEVTYRYAFIPDGVLQLVIHDHTGSLTAGSTDEHHDSTASVRVRTLNEGTTYTSVRVRTLNERITSSISEFM